MFRGLAASLLVLLGSGIARGDGYRIPYHGGAAAGQAEAFAAQADDPSALFYNPAGLTQLGGVQSSVGANLVGGYTSFTSSSGLRSRGDLGEVMAFPPPSNFYLTANLKDLGFEALGPLSVGLGLTSPYGLATRWPDPTGFEATVTRAKLPLLDIKPTLAYRIGDMLSIGLGADIYTFAGFIGSGGYEAQNDTPGVGRIETNMDGTTAGFNASLLLTPWRTGDGKPRLNLGFVYRSGAKLPLHGSFSVNGIRQATVNSALELPEVISAAVAVWPIRDGSHEWKLEYDMDFVGWDSFRSFDMHLSNGVTMSYPENWRATYSLSAGTEFKWLKPDPLPHWEVALRGGYQRSNAAVPTQTFSPILTDADWNLIAVGLGLTCKDEGSFLGLIPCGGGEGSLLPKTIGVDLAFQTALFEPRNIVDNINPSVEGRYKTVLYIGSINFRLSY